MSLNPEDEWTPNFSILYQMKDWNPLEKFTFMVAYPKDFPGKANIWRQSTNPAERNAPGVSGYEKIEMAWAGGLI
jgi:hypothetical protein